MPQKFYSAVIFTRIMHTTTLNTILFCHFAANISQVPPLSLQEVENSDYSPNLDTGGLPQGLSQIQCVQYQCLVLNLARRM